MLSAREASSEPVAPRAARTTRTISAWRVRQLACHRAIEPPATRIPTSWAFRGDPPVHERRCTSSRSGRKVREQREHARSSWCSVQDSPGVGDGSAGWRLCSRRYRSALRWRAGGLSAGAARPQQRPGDRSLAAGGRESSLCRTPPGAERHRVTCMPKLAEPYCRPQCGHGRKVGRIMHAERKKVLASFSLLRGQPSEAEIPASLRLYAAMRPRGRHGVVSRPAGSMQLIVAARAVVGGDASRPDAHVFSHAWPRRLVLRLTAELCACV